MKNSVAILLAAGLGRKFMPYSTVRNKCAFPIANEPVVARLAKQLKTLGFSRIAVVVGYEEASIRAALFPLQDPSIVFVRQASGTTGTIPAALSALSETGVLANGESALVLYGDCLMATEDIRAVWEAHTRQGAAAALLCAPMNEERAIDWIGCALKPDRTLASVRGHGDGTAFRIAGAFAFGKDAYPYLQNAPSHFTHLSVGAMPPAESDLADALGTMASNGLGVVGVETTCPSADLDKRWHIFNATRLALEERMSSLTQSIIQPSARVSDGADIEGHIVVEAGATIGKRVVLKGNTWIGANTQVINGAIVGAGVIIGAGTRVSDYCLVNGGSVIGNRCVVGHGGEMDGVMLDGSYIYHYSEIYGVLGLAVDIGAATVCGTLRFDDGETPHRLNGRREYPRIGGDATYFGDYVRTGVNVITQPGVTIGSYSCVGAGVVLYNDVPDRKLILLKQETVEREWGPDRYGW